MIQLLYTYPDSVILQGVCEDFNVPYITVSEMLEDSYLTLIEPDMVTDFEDALKTAPAKMFFIGSYNMDGSQYIWTEPIEIQRNHTINKYKDDLKDVIIYNEQGEPIGERRPTTQEALDTQVNLIFGYPNRNLI